jgi:hypothetical protein
VHGDTHELTIDRPWADAENVVRVQSDGPGSSRWVRISVDTGNSAVFSFQVERASAG